MCTSVLPACKYMHQGGCLISVEVRRGPRIPWNRRYGWIHVIIWGFESGTMVVCKCEDSSLVFILSDFPFFLFLTFIFHQPPPSSVRITTKSCAVSRHHFISVQSRQIINKDRHSSIWSYYRSHSDSLLSIYWVNSSVNKTHYPPPIFENLSKEILHFPDGRIPQCELEACHTRGRGKAQTDGEAQCDCCGWCLLLLMFPAYLYFLSLLLPNF